MAERRYTKSHEWLTVEGKSVTVGITDFAQAQLGDVVFLELPSPGRKLDAGEMPPPGTSPSGRGIAEKPLINGGAHE